MLRKKPQQQIKSIISTKQQQQQYTTLINSKKAVSSKVDAPNSHSSVPNRSEADSWKAKFVKGCDTPSGSFISIAISASTRKQLLRRRERGGDRISSSRSPSSLSPLSVFPEKVHLFRISLDRVLFSVFFYEMKFWFWNGRDFSCGSVAVGCIIGKRALCFF